MTIVWCLISAWLGAVVAYAAFRCRPAVQRMAPEDTRGALRLAHMSLNLVARRLDKRRPVAWWLKRKWPVYRNMRWGSTRGGFTAVPISENIDLETRELAADDPRGKIEAAANRIADKLLAYNGPIGGFVWDEALGGLDFCHSLTDHETGVCLRLMRAYDVQNNNWIMKMDTKVLV